MAAKIRERLGTRPAALTASENAVAGRQSEIGRLDSQISTVTRNLALAESQEIFAGIQKVLQGLNSERAKAVTELAKLESVHRPHPQCNELVDRAIQQIGELPKLADDPSNLAAIRLLFDRLDLQMFLRFHSVPKKKRIVNQLAGGVLTIGAIDPPVQKYTGLTGTMNVKNLADTQRPNGLPAGQKPDNSSRGEKSSRNVNRDDRTPLELFIGGVRDWDAGSRRILSQAAG